MKKFFYPLLGILFIFSLSCSNDNGDGPGSGTDDDGQGGVDKSANLLTTGASANDILSNTNFDKLQIQIAYVTGFRPTQQTIDNFQDYLRQHTFKEDIEIIYNELPSPNEETLTLQEIANLEDENRTAYNDGSTLAVYIYFADAPADGDDEDASLVTLGAVYFNTSMVIYEQTIRELASRSLLISVTDVETATLNHEFGHLFGLVNLGTIPVNDHEDPESENHCNVEGCLMRAELQFSASKIMSPIAKSTEELKSACSLSGNTVLNLLIQEVNKSAVVPDLDAECVLDLQNNGGR
ncbi:hypothetical protein [Allomuricauda sp. SCSIO 65647]|uniref:hypothetical protein n=1 Tax=Allomuricauda sp. SCSIO 65647 TaxID=2908843 RepID=UPI001F48B20A|nr:hypothetical protein [Muricauda sp. SCSIO 65647]UJH66632.1 hypothetical protein L0P89_11740 [Muricauda sp. SCSIO 65647]